MKGGTSWCTASENIQTHPLQFMCFRSCSVSRRGCCHDTKGTKEAAQRSIQKLKAMEKDFAISTYAFNFIEVVGQCSFDFWQCQCITMIIHILHSSYLDIFKLAGWTDWSFGGIWSQISMSRDIFLLKSFMESALRVGRSTDSSAGFVELILLSNTKAAFILVG